MLYVRRLVATLQYGGGAVTLKEFIKKLEDNFEGRITKSVIEPSWLMREFRQAVQDVILDAVEKVPENND